MASVQDTLLPQLMRLAWFPPQAMEPPAPLVIERELVAFPPELPRALACQLAWVALVVRQACILWAV